MPAALDLHAEVQVLWRYRVPTADRSPERVHVGWTRSRRPMDEEAVPRGPSARGRRDDHDATIDVGRAGRGTDVLPRPRPGPIAPRPGARPGDASPARGRA